MWHMIIGPCFILKFVFFIIKCNLEFFTVELICMIFKGVGFNENLFLNQLMCNEIIVLYQVYFLMKANQSIILRYDFHA